MADQTESVELKFFQEIGRDFLARRTRALLADEMRLGKTAQALTACDLIGARSILVICPAIARPTWREEAKVWAPRMADRMRVVSYDYARLHHKELTASRWDVLVLDEVHYLKSTEAQRTQTILGRGGIAWSADRIWALSGTPAPNHAGELWPLLRACGVIKTKYYDFINYFCNVDPDGKPFGTKTKHIPQLRGILDNFMIRRRKSEVATELPECSVYPYYIESSTEFLDLIRPVEGKRLAEQSRVLESKLRDLLAKTPKRRHMEVLENHIQEYATLRRVTGILKTPAIYDTIRFEIENGLVDKLVVFAYHRDPMVLLHQLLNQEAGINTEIIYGGTPEKKREAALRRFRLPKTRADSSKVMVAQIQAAGTAIDLSCAHQGIMLERDWVPGNNAQALERMGGYKQTQPITIRDVVLPGSVDEIISDVLNRKMRELSAIFD